MSSTEKDAAGMSDGAAQETSADLEAAPAPESGASRTDEMRADSDDTREPAAQSPQASDAADASAASPGAQTPQADGEGAAARESAQAAPHDSEKTGVSINLAKESDGASETASAASAAAEDKSRHADEASRKPDQPGAGRDAPASPQETAPKAGRCLLVFNALSHVGPLALLVFLALMVWPDYWQALEGEALYCPPEATAITTFLNSVAQQNLLEPAGASGAALVAQWPGFVWLCALLALIPMPAPLIWPLAASLCAAFALLATWLLAKFCRLGSHTAFAAGLVLLCTPIFAPLGHFVGESALAAACAVFALACFTRGWLRERAWLALPLAFAATALAGLSGGPFGVILPLLASLFFLIWIGKPGRACRGDAVFGFILLLVILGVWLGLAILKGSNPAYLESLLGHVWLSPWPLADAWALTGILILLGVLPWTCLVICVSWLRVCREAGRTLGASRRENGSAMLWIGAVLAWLLSFAIADSAHFVLVVSACLLAILFGKAFLILPPAGHRLFFFLCALGLLCAGLFLLGAGFEFSQPLVFSVLPFAMPQNIASQLAGMSGLWVAGALCLFGVAVICIRFLRGDQGGGPLIFCTMLCVFLSQPAVLMIAPELGKGEASQLRTLQAIEAAFQTRLQGQSPVVAPALPSISPDSSNPENPANGSALPEAPALPPAVPDLTAPQNPAQNQPEQTGRAGQPGQADMGGQTGLIDQIDQADQGARSNQDKPEVPGAPENAAPENAAPETGAPGGGRNKMTLPQDSPESSDSAAPLQGSPAEAGNGPDEEAVIIFQPAPNGANLPANPSPAGEAPAIQEQSGGTLIIRAPENDAAAPQDGAQAQ